MNRKQRRVQTAKTRQAVKKDEGHCVLCARSAVPDDIKADICRVVRAVQFRDMPANHCLLRAGIGFITLCVLGWQPDMSVGAMLYRAGVDPIRDVVAFCGPGNVGQIVNGMFVGHVWLEFDGELIDFTCRDWLTLDPSTESLDLGLGPIQWQAPPPTFVWATRSLFEWQPTGAPAMGELWYGPWAGDPPHHFTDRLGELASDSAFKSSLAVNLSRISLPERVANLEPNREEKRDE